MVTKIVSRKSIRGLLNYNENKVNQGKANLIMASKFGMDLEKLDFHAKLQRFAYHTSKNSRVKTNALHIMLNFDKSDKLNLPLLQELASKYMDRIGFGEQPFLVYLHKDAHHPHLHLITTNVQADGKRISITNIGKILSETARKDLEKEYNLIKAEGRNQSLNNSLPLHIEKALYGQLPTKKAISNVVTQVLNEYRFTSFAEYNAVLGLFGVKADQGKDDSVMFEKRGLVYSIIDLKGNFIGIPFKASALSSKPTLDTVEKKYEQNKERRKLHQEGLKVKIDSIFQKYSSLTQATFLSELKKLGVDLILCRNKQGYVYGSTFIDHRNKTVFNGSAIGKSYSASGLSERFGTSDVLKTFLKPNQSTKSYLSKASEESSKSFLSPTNETHYLERLIGKPQDDNTLGIPKKKKRKRGRFL